MSKNRSRSYSERGIVSLKKGELEVVVSTQFQQSADLHIFLTDPPPGARFNKAIFLHFTKNSEDVGASNEQDLNEPVDGFDDDMDEGVQDSEASSESPVKQEDPTYDPPKLEHLIHREAEQLIFRILRAPAAGERRYAHQAARLLEHPLKEQLLSRLIGMFHKASSVEEKKEREDRVFLEKKESQRPQTRKKQSRGRRRGRYKKH